MIKVVEEVFFRNFEGVKQVRGKWSGTNLSNLRVHLSGRSICNSESKGKSASCAMLRIIYRDQDLVVVHKPPGLLVHRTRISEDRVFLLQQLREQIGQRLYPVHRLDRATAGLIAFGLSSEAARHLNRAFTGHQVQKTYLAIVRGYTPESGQIERPLEKDGSGEMQDARTDYRRLATAELPFPVSRYATARYSLVEVRPHTGRMHQIRRHFNHLRHPIVGDRKHGPRHHNRLWEAQFQCRQMMLLAWRLRLPHPQSGAEMSFQTEPELEMQRMMGVLGFADLIPGPNPQT